MTLVDVALGVMTDPLVAWKHAYDEDAIARVMAASPPGMPVGPLDIFDLLGVLGYMAEIARLDGELRAVLRRMTRPMFVIGKAAGADGAASRTSTADEVGGDPGD